MRYLHVMIVAWYRVFIVNSVNRNVRTTLPFLVTYGYVEMN